MLGIEKKAGNKLCCLVGSPVKDEHESYLKGDEEQFAGVHINRLVYCLQAKVVLVPEEQGSSASALI